MFACFLRRCHARGERPVSDPTPVFDDLREESEELDRLVAGLSAEQWALATPAPGWSVAHQIAHLAWTDHSALLAATDTDAFHVLVEKALVSPGSFVDDGAEEDRYAGTYLGKRELRALVATPASRSTKTRRRS
jgi:uncharacterized protein (TIGR03083 family)